MVRLFALAIPVAIGVAALLVPARLVAQPTPPARTDSTRCVALARLSLLDLQEAPTKILRARLVNVPASGLEGQTFGPVAGAPIPTRLKQYCQVVGYVAPQNKFELRLPLPADWNQRFFLTTCGGFCGTLDGAACNPALARGYASVTTNGGHESGPGFDGLWAASAPRLQEDYAWRGMHVVAIAAKTITTRFYERPIARSYISGCSKGGHAVLKQAQMFPEDFDGYLPIAPVYDIAGRALAGAWFAQAVNDGKGGSVLDNSAVDAVHRSVLARCGSQAGVDEGMVTDPASCDWRPDMIVCTPGGSPSGCLTSQQVDAVRRLMSPVKSSRGDVVYGFPYVPGTETEWAFWNYHFFANYQVGQQFVKYLADSVPRDNVDPFTFDFDRLPATLTRAHALYDATSPDLRAVKARGGRILMWHGLADGGIMATSSVAYYENVMKAMGGRADTESFFRLFLIPGVHHCGGGPGLADFDALTLLEAWVEKGQAPDVLIARRMANGVPERTRPIYPYPVVARYRGSGDPRAAESFVSFDPTRRQR